MLVHHDVRVHNFGDALWRPMASLPPSRELRCRDLETGEIVADHLGPFRETVWPGQDTIVLMPVGTPPREGRYGLELDVVHDPRASVGVRGGTITVYPPNDVPAHGGGDALLDARRQGRERDAVQETAEALEAAAAELRATRRYRVAETLTRLAGSRRSVAGESES